MASKDLLYFYLIVAVLLQPLPPSLGNFLSPLLSPLPGSCSEYPVFTFSVNPFAFITRQTNIFEICASLSFVMGSWLVPIALSVGDFCWVRGCCLRLLNCCHFHRFFSFLIAVFFVLSLPCCASHMQRSCAKEWNVGRGVASLPEMAVYPMSASAT